MKTIVSLTLLLLFIQCRETASRRETPPATMQNSPSPTGIIDTTQKSIHVLVALCDNKYQGIVPVNQKVGNGQDPVNNLYWGWGYGVKTYFKNSKEWIFIRSEKKEYPVLERLVFKSKVSDFYLVADAYDGRNMKECINSYLSGLAGLQNDTIIYNGKTIGMLGNSRLLAFVGHNGLMDFRLENSFENKDGRKRDGIILACYSKSYFTGFLKQANANPLLWTTNLMGPEAYTLHDALSAYINKESASAVQEKAAMAYAKYTKCSVKAAKGLLVTGW